VSSTARTPPSASRHARESLGPGDDRSEIPRKSCLPEARDSSWSTEAKAPPVRSAAIDGIYRRIVRTGLPGPPVKSMREVEAGLVRQFKRRCHTFLPTRLTKTTGWNGSR
jgi:hypothetical protein